VKLEGFCKVFLPGLSGKEYPWTESSPMRDSVSSPPRHHCILSARDITDKIAGRALEAPLEGLSLAKRRLAGSET